MPRRTPTYNIEYFKKGSVLSGASEERGFVTLDNNLESYVGIIGPGIISGWTLDQTDDLTVQILPGKGIIDGFAMESPYVVKLRSDMVAGDREVEKVLFEFTSDGDIIPRNDLTASQRAVYVSVVTLYRPDFAPVGDIEDAFVKVVISTSLDLFDDIDNFIYAERPVSAEPFPAADDFPTIETPPAREGFSTYELFRAAQDAYEDQLEDISSYTFQTDPDNHFTAVEFVIEPGVFSSATNRILLGKIVTRNGTIRNIDTSGVDTIAGLDSKIRDFAKQALVAHRHGGSRNFDPPKIRLETDIRAGILSSYNTNTGTAIFTVTEKDRSGVSLGHGHTYKIDSEGNGITISQSSSDVANHYHKIENFVLQSPQGDIDPVDDHTHSILTVEEKADTWTNDSQFIVKVNGEDSADETSSDVTVDAVAKTIKFDTTIGAAFSTYSSSFSVQFSNSTLSYSFSAKSATVFGFMIDMLVDFESTFREQIDAELDRIDSQNLTGDVFAFHPFHFTLFDEETGEAIGIVGNIPDIQEQSNVAQVLLQDQGDQFIFTSPAARDITISLSSVKGDTDKVSIEILGNSEVTGKLKVENILFINAEKFLLGKFEPERIPFVSHVGRLEERFSPFEFSLLSNDGFRYVISPSATDVELDHSHRAFLNLEGDGFTTDTLIGDEVVFNAKGNSGDTFFIDHSHGVDIFTPNSSSSQGLLDWQNDINEIQIADSAHVHNLITASRGDNKTVYSLREDSDGNLFVGTSDGLLMIPSDPAYLFVVNGIEFKFHGSDLFSLLEDAGAQYGLDTGLLFVVTEDIYLEQINEAEEVLLEDGDSALLLGESVPDREQDQVMIKRVLSFQMPAFSSIVEKTNIDVSPFDTVIAKIETKNEVTGATEINSVLVEKDLNATPVWSIAIKPFLTPSAAYVSSISRIDIITVGSNLVAKNTDISKNANKRWSEVDISPTVGVIRKVVPDANDDFWIVTDNGVYVSQSYAEGNIFDDTTLPGKDPDIRDIVEATKDSIFVVSRDGIFETINGGKSWTKKLDITGGFDQIVRDFTLDLSDTVLGHNHLVDVDIDGNGFLTESIGPGLKHVHQVSSWEVQDTMGHTHVIISTLYAIGNNKKIFKSTDGGDTWVQFGLLPAGEIGKVFAAFGQVLVAQEEGLFRTLGGTNFINILKKKIYSFEWTHDLSGFIAGSDNEIFRTFDGEIYSQIHSFTGIPVPILFQEGLKKNFGYAYSNESFTFHFEDFLITDESSSALVDFGRWIADEGAWNESSPYDIYIENRLVLSTKSNVDNRELEGFSFTVSPSDGILDFSASVNLSEKIDIFDDTIRIDDSSSFVVGERIFVSQTVSSQEVVSVTEDKVSGISNSTSDKNTEFFATITAINGGRMTLDSRSTVNISLPATVIKLPSLDGNSEIEVNIFQSLLSNIGELNHEELEDNLSIVSDGRPFKFNDSYLSNLLLLTQAVRYSYPDINEEFKNSAFFDFRYSDGDPSSIFPDIDGFIDLETTEIYNQELFASDFSVKGANSINKILIGYGNFDGSIIVATDVGIFSAKLDENLEANWFYASALPFPVHDIIIFFNGTRILAATDQGAFSSIDLEEWTLESSLAIRYPLYTFELRWVDQDIITASSHTASFVSNADGTGTITAISGAPYLDFLENRVIFVSGAGEKNGSYSIRVVGDEGASLSLTAGFEGADATIPGVTIIMGAWWQQWNQDENILNANLTNTLLAGGENRISINDFAILSQWTESDVDVEIDNFITRDISALSNGLLLSAVNGKASANEISHILRSSDIGRRWSTLRSFEEVRGKIESSRVSDFNNSILTVTYTKPEDYVYVDGILDQSDISIFSSESLIAIAEGKIVWNETRDSQDKIFVFGNSIDTLVKERSEDLIFVVVPLKTNTIMETPEQTVFFGTNRGVYSDKNSIAGRFSVEGTILRTGFTASIDRIDISGSIVAFNGNDIISGNAVFSIEADSTVRTGDLIGQKFYVTDTAPIEVYTVVSNEAVAVTGELSVELNAALDASYIGKKFTVVGDTSTIFTNFSSPTQLNQFENGTLFVASNEFDNLGRSYTIKRNTSAIIELERALTPISTLTGAVTEGDIDLRPGQSINIVDSSQRIQLVVSLDRDFRDNVLNELDFRSFNEETLLSSNVFLTFPIRSNKNNTIELETDASSTIGVVNTDGSVDQLPAVLGFTTGERFEITGNIFEPLDGFANKKTSVGSDHFHDLDLVNDFVSGTIDSFGTTNDQSVTFTVADTVLFDSVIVQKQGDLFEDAKIIFTNNDSLSIRYESEVISHTATTITVRTKDLSRWIFVETDVSFISEGWKWEINASNYGYTDGTFYKDFRAIQEKITENVGLGDTIVDLESTSGIVAGDKVRLQDDTISFEINEVLSITSVTRLTLADPVGRTFFKTRNPQLQVLRDVFLNTHEHQVRSNELQVVSVEEYLNRGYPSQHSHRVLPLIADVAVLINRNNQIFSAGSDSIIYRSENEGDVWRQEVDLNDFLENTEGILGVSAGTFDNNKLVFGATTGNIFIEDVTSGEVIKLEPPL